MQRVTLSFTDTDTEDNEDISRVSSSHASYTEETESITNVLNLFSRLLHSMGYHYDFVGVRARLSNEDSIEHWSDY